jgi:hypothetical protein
MRHFARGAVSIFDDDEPIGTMTDAFPGTDAEQTSALNGEAAR